MRDELTSSIQFEGSLHFQNKDRTFIVGHLEGTPAVFIDRWKDLFFLYKKLPQKQLLKPLNIYTHRRPIQIRVFIILKNKILGSLKFQDGNKRLKIHPLKYFFGDPVL